MGHGSSNFDPKVGTPVAVAMFYLISVTTRQTFGFRSSGSSSKAAVSQCSRNLRTDGPTSEKARAIAQLTIRLGPDHEQFGSRAAFSECGRRGVLMMMPSWALTDQSTEYHHDFW
jgi:hypothetical protein